MTLLNSNLEFTCNDRPNNKFALRDAVMIDDFAKLMEIAGGKEVSIADEATRNLVKVALTVSRKIPGYLKSLVFSMAVRQTEAEGNVSHSPNNFRENIGAGAKSAKYSELSTTEKEVFGKIEAELKTDEAYDVYIKPCLKLFFWLASIIDKLWDDETPEGRDYRAIFDYALASTLNVSESAIRLWNELEYLPTKYMVVNPVTDEPVYDHDCDLKKLRKLRIKDLLANMFKYAMNRNVSIAVPVFTVEEVIAIGEIHCESNLSSYRKQALIDSLLTNGDDADALYFGLQCFADYEKATALSYAEKKDLKAKKERTVEENERLWGCELAERAVTVAGSWRTDPTLKLIANNFLKNRTGSFLINAYRKTSAYKVLAADLTVKAMQYGRSTRYICTARA